MPPPAKQPSTIWIALPDLYTARCENGALRITRIPHPGDPRPSVKSLYGNSTSLHAADINIVLGALITLIRAETTSWLASH